MVKRSQVKKYQKGGYNNSRSKGKNYPPKFSRPAQFKNKSRRIRRRSASPKFRNRRYNENPKTKFRRRRRSFERNNKRPKMSDEERKTQIMDKLDDELDNYWIKNKKEDKVQEGLDNQLDDYFGKEKKAFNEETKIENQAITSIYNGGLNLNPMQYQSQMTDPNMMCQMPVTTMYSDISNQSMNPMFSAMNTAGYTYQYPS